MILALVAFSLRILFLVRFEASPLFVPVSGGNDCWLYYSIAQRCAEGSWIPESVFQYMPLYAWLLGGIALVAGSKTLLIAALLGALLDTATVVLIFKFARRCAAPRAAAFIGALLFAVYPLAITYSTLNMPNTMNAFCVLLLAYILHGFTRDTPLWKWIATGLFAGIVSLSFAGMLLLLVVTSLWFAVRFVRTGPVALAKVAAFFIVALLPIVPVTLHNYRAEGQFVLMTAHGGFNFWLGNNEDATGYTILPKGFRGDRGNLLADAKDDAEKREGRKLTAAEFSKHWNDRAKKFIAENPGASAVLFAKKFRNFWSATEYDDLRMLPMLRLTGVAFTWPVWPGFAFISVLGFTGLLTARGCGIVRLFTLTSMLSIVMFFITSRYRLTVCPLLCVLGALALGQLMSAIANRKSQVASVIAFVPALALAFWPVPDTDFRTLDHYNTATHLMEKAKQTGDIELVKDALRHANSGLAVDPVVYELHFIAGNALFGLERTNDAVRAYQSTLRINPRHAPAYFNLGVIAHLGGDHAAALSNITRAVELDPAFTDARQMLDRLTNEPPSKNRD